MSRAFETLAKEIDESPEPMDAIKVLLAQGNTFMSNSQRARQFEAERRDRRSMHEATVQAAEIRRSRDAKPSKAELAAMIVMAREELGEVEFQEALGLPAPRGPLHGE